MGNDDQDIDSMFDFSREAPKAGSEPLHLRYNRAERLKRAPDMVKNLHEGKYTTKPGFVKSLFTTPASALLALAIIIMIPLIVFLKKNNAQAVSKDFDFQLDCKIEKFHADAAQNDAEETNGTLFAQLTIEPKSYKYSNEAVRCMFFVLGAQDIVLKYSQVESMYLGEKLVLSSPIPLRQSPETVKAIKAQVEIADTIFVLKKNME